MDTKLVMIKLDKLQELATILTRYELKYVDKNSNYIKVKLK